MLFQMIQPDIEKATPNDCEFCAIAQMFRRLIPDLYYVRVRYTQAYLEYTDETREICHLPETVTNFIYDYDDNKPVEPICFELAIQRQVLNIQASLPKNEQITV